LQIEICRYCSEGKPPGQALQTNQIQTNFVNADLIAGGLSPLKPEVIPRVKQWKKSGYRVSDFVEYPRWRVFICSYCLEIAEHEIEEMLSQEQSR